MTRSRSERSTEGDTARQSISPLAPCVPRSGSRSRWTSLHGSARGLAIASLVQQADAPVLVLASDNQTAHRLETELEFYLGPEIPILRFPDWETLPYDLFSPHQDIVSERLEIAARLPTLSAGVLVTVVTTAMGRIAPRGFVDGHRFRIESGDRVGIDTLRQQLERAGYACVSQVMEHGEYAVRGSLFDLFPMGAGVPLRIDLLDDEVESLRAFDPDSQRSTRRIDRIDLLPAREFPTSPDAVSTFRRAWRRRFEGDPSRCPIYREVSQGGWPAGIEYFLPLFFEQTATLFDYLPPGTIAVLAEDVHDSAKAFWADTRDRYRDRCHDRERPILPPGEIFLPVEDLFARLAAYPGVRLRRGGNSGRGADIRFATRTPPALPIDGRSERPIGFLEDFLAAHAGRCLVVAETPGRREILLETLSAHGLKPGLVESWGKFLSGDSRLAMTVAELEDGACIDSPAIAVVTESQLFGARAAQRRRRRGRKGDAEGLVRDLNELRIGAPVVHEAHGVGRYAGLEVLAIGGTSGEFLRIDYADGDKLYVPVGSLDLVSRYTGVDPESVRCTSLAADNGSAPAGKRRSGWPTSLRNCSRCRHEGQADQGSRSRWNPSTSRVSRQAFPFEETPDQAEAIRQVVSDMSRAAPMDRLVCGDVGFGKTEVAMRAAFIAVQSGRQVAVLVPTTLLAQQHQQTFGDRLRIGRYESNSSRAFAHGTRRTRSCAVSRTGPWTSSSAPTSCSKEASDSNVSDWW